MVSNNIKQKLKLCLRESKMRVEGSFTAEKLLKNFSVSKKLTVCAFYDISKEGGMANMDVLVRLEALSRKGHVVYLFSLEDGKNKSIVRKKSNFIVFSKVKQLRWLFIVSILQNFAIMTNAVAKIKPDVIETTSLPWLSTPAWLVSRVFNISFVIFCRELSERRLALPKPALLFLERLRNFVLRRADLVAAINKPIETYLEGIIKRDILAIPFPVGMKSFESKYTNQRESRKKLGINLDDKVVLYMGDLSPGRGVDNLIVAFKSILETHENVRLILGGRGDRSYLVRLIRKYGLENHVTFIQWVPYEKIPEIMAVADICVEPYSKPGLERFTPSGKVLEYMATGKSVIAVDVEGIAGHIESGFNGLLIKSGSSSELYRSLLFLLSDENERKRIAQNARQTIERYHNPEITASLYGKALFSIIRKRE